MRACSARLLCAPAKLGVDCSLMASAGLAGVLGVVRALGGTAICLGGLAVAHLGFISRNPILFSVAASLMTLFESLIPSLLFGLEVSRLAVKGN
jgi:hypothetical protein